MHWWKTRQVIWGTWTIIWNHFYQMTNIFTKTLLSCSGAGNYSDECRAALSTHITSWENVTGGKMPNFTHKNAVCEFMTCNMCGATHTNRDQTCCSGGTKCFNLNNKRKWNHRKNRHFLHLLGSKPKYIWAAKNEHDESTWHVKSQTINIRRYDWCVFPLIKMFYCKTEMQWGVFLQLLWVGMVLLHTCSQKCSGMQSSLC